MSKIQNALLDQTANFLLKNMRCSTFWTLRQSFSLCNFSKMMLNEKYDINGTSINLWETLSNQLKPFTCQKKKLFTNMNEIYQEGEREIHSFFIIISVNYRVLLCVWYLSIVRQICVNWSSVWYFIMTNIFFTSLNTLEWEQSHQLFDRFIYLIFYFIKLFEYIVIM